MHISAICANAAEFFLYLAQMAASCHQVGVGIDNGQAGDSSNTIAPTCTDVRTKIKKEESFSFCLLFSVCLRIHFTFPYIYSSPCLLPSTFLCKYSVLSCVPCNCCPLSCPRCPPLSCVPCNLCRPCPVFPLPLSFTVLCSLSPLSSTVFCSL